MYLAVHDGGRAVKNHSVFAAEKLEKLSCPTESICSLDSTAGGAGPTSIMKVFRVYCKRNFTKWPKELEIFSKIMNS